MYDVWRKSAQIQRTKKEILSELPADVSGEELVFDSSVLFGVFPVRFEWEMTPKPESKSYQLEERALISRSWYLLFIFSCMGIFIGFTGFTRLEGVLFLLSFVCVGVSLFSFLFLFATVASLSSSIEDLFKQSGDTTECLPVASLLIPSLFLLFFIVLFDGIVQLVALTAVLGLNLGYYWYHPRIRRFSYRWQSWLVGRLEELPLITSNYITGVIFAIILLSVFVLSYQSNLFLTLLVNFPFWFPAILSVVFLLLMIGIGTVLLDSWEYERPKFQQEGNNITGGRAVLVTGGLVLVSSVGLGIAAYLFLQGVTWLIPRYGSLGLSVFVIVMGSPIIFLGIGLVYQVLTVVRNLTMIYSNSEHRDLTHVLDVDADTHVLDHDGVFAGALSLYNDYIIVSQGIIDQLNEDELAAVLAHEEAHIKFNETRLTLLIAILSPLLLTGKNILYGVLDFRGREYRADRKAVERVDHPGQVRDALESLQGIRAETSKESLATVTPTLVAMKSGDEETGRIRTILDFYFGDFAFSKAHPSLQERLDRLD